VSFAASFAASGFSTNLAASLSALPSPLDPASEVPGSDDSPEHARNVAGSIATTSRREHFKHLMARP
jgi:hypothetical protein